MRVTTLASMLKRSIAVLLCPLLLMGCSEWRAETRPAVSVVQSEKKPPDLRLTLLDGRRVTLYETTVREDSLLVGRLRRDASDRRTSTLAPFPSRLVQDSVRVADVRSVEKSYHSGGKTGLLILGLTVGLIATFAILVGASLSSDPISG